jgi:hypothetical protein
MEGVRFRGKRVDMVEHQHRFRRGSSSNQNKLPPSRGAYFIGGALRRGGAGLSASQAGSPTAV